jgi:hypothetical protein
MHLEDEKVGGGGCLPISPQQLNTAFYGLTSSSEEMIKREGGPWNAMIVTHQGPACVCVQIMTLCRYYQLMEQLQENLEEYDKLQHLASEYYTSYYSNATT